MSAAAKFDRSFFSEKFISRQISIDHAQRSAKILSLFLLWMFVRWLQHCRSTSRQNSSEMLCRILIVGFHSDFVGFQMCFINSGNLVHIVKRTCIFNAFLQFKSEIWVRRRISQRKSFLKQKPYSFWLFDFCIRISLRHRFRARETHTKWKRLLENEFSK